MKDDHKLEKDKEVVSGERPQWHKLHSRNFVDRERQLAHIVQEKVDQSSYADAQNAAISIVKDDIFALWIHFRDEITKEHDLIASRLTWALTFNSFGITAWAVLAGTALDPAKTKAYMVLVVMFALPFAAIIVTGCAWWSMRQADIRITEWHSCRDRMLRLDQAERLWWWIPLSWVPGVESKNKQSDKTHSGAMRVPIWWIPLTIGILWLVVIVVTWNISSGLSSRPA